MLARLERKLADMQTWVDSVGFVGDWPAAIALAMLRTRPATGGGLLARASRQLVSQAWIRPQSLKGLGVRIDPANLSEFAIYEEMFIDGVYDLQRVSFTPDTVVDCGAYEGFFSLLAHAKFPAARIVAFEPNAQNYEKLSANLRGNNLEIEARAEAVSTKDGVAAFSGAGCGGRIGIEGTDSVAVATADLRRVIASLHAHQLLLKLDIEGEEATLLPALLPVLPRRCAIFFEWHHGREAFQGVADLLNTHQLSTSITRVNQVDGLTFIDAFAQRN